MKNLSKHNLLYFFILSSFFCFTSNGQENKTTISVDPKIDQLLKEKRKLNTGLFLNEGYKIQIFYGNSEESKKKLIEFKKEFKNATWRIYEPKFKN